MTINELCDLYIELSQTISVLHTQVQAAKDVLELIPDAANLAALQTLQKQLNTANERRAEIQKLLNQYYCRANT